MINPKHSQKEGGFIALISAIIISAILLGLSITTSSGAFSARGNSLDIEFKRQSLAFAESCIHIALQRIAENYNYAPVNEIIFIDSEKCTIESVVYDTEDTVLHRKDATIISHAEFQGTWSTVETRIHILNPFFTHSPTAQKITIISWREL